MSADLKPCPFCGGTAFMVQKENHATCLTPGCCIGPVSGADSWNTRAPQWLPIESAPRDGTLILLGRAGDEADDRLPISTPGRWFEGYEDGADYMGHDDGFMDTDFQEFSCPRTFGAESCRSSGFQPTHWQPLPAPPEVQP